MFRKFLVLKQSNISFIVNVKIHPVGSFDDASSCSAFAPFGSPRSASQLLSVVVENLLTRLLSRFQEIDFFAYFEFWYCQINAIWRISWNTLSFSSIRSANITSPGPYERSSGSILSGVFICKFFSRQKQLPKRRAAYGPNIADKIASFTNYALPHHFL